MGNTSAHTRLLNQSNRNVCVFLTQDKLEVDAFIAKLDAPGGMMMSSPRPPTRPGGMVRFGFRGDIAGHCVLASQMCQLLWKENQYVSIFVEDDEKICSKHAVVSVSPDNHVFRGETVTLRCDIQGEGDTGWTNSWYKNNYSIYPYNTYNPYMISSVTQYYSGTYTCSGYRGRDSQSSEISNAVTLTVSVKPTPELTSSLTGAALVGNPVTLHCKLDQSAGWSFYWSRHTQNPENETNTAANSYNISSVAPSDGGQYWCRAGRGNPVYYTHYSDALWVNVTAADSSSLGQISLTVGQSLVVLFILLTLLWCYKTKKNLCVTVLGVSQTSIRHQIRPRESQEKLPTYMTQLSQQTGAAQMNLQTTSVMSLMLRS
ncbi:uncharacterized protein LOC118240641 [Electrophorus electricus]|uniref:uncharacterized protein LOC118240641 n=1 Tax=Electrophorus electricus TaxID=8005 RepID=UPI0015D038F2|nr:uncharacterized protein LOC118240641 [Electrophorus electricus]